jgi:hypothetical protein
MANRRPPANHRAAHQIPVVERRRAAVELRRDGKSWQEIADLLGYDSKGGACKDVSRALQAAVADLALPLEEYRQLELDRLDAELERLGQMYATIEAILERQHVTIQNGRIVLLNDSPVPDFGPVLAAADRLLKIEDSRRRNGERRAKLLGLDAPTRTEGVLTLDVIEASIAQLTAQADAARTQAEPADEAS